MYSSFKEPARWLRERSTTRDVESKDVKKSPRCAGNQVAGIHPTVEMNALAGIIGASQSFWTRTIASNADGMSGSLVRIRRVNGHDVQKELEMRRPVEIIVRQ